MNFLRIILPFRVIVVLVSFASPAWGQMGGGATYRPAQPTFSPWLNLYQKNGGALDNYHTFVLPDMQLRDTLRQQNTMIQEQGQGIRELSGQMTAAQQARVPAHPTGTGGVFMDYSHYYGLSGQASGQATRQRPAVRAPGRGR
jgi:hypothetical protein